MCTIGVSQSGQNRIPSGTVQSTLLMGRDSYRSLRTDLGFDVRVWVLRKGEGYRKGDGRYSYVYIDPLGKKRTIYANVVPLQVAYIW